MLPTDLDPASRLKIGRALLRVGIVVVLLGVIAAAAVALTPTDPDTSTPTQNTQFGLVFCLGPALLGGVPCIIVGRQLSKQDHPDDIGRLYRGF